MLVENAHKKIEAAEARARGRRARRSCIGAARELGPSMFGALLVLTIAFLPVFTLEGEEGRLFRPLALAKTFSMAVRLALRHHARARADGDVPRRDASGPRRKNPINRVCIAAYRPVLRACLRFR